MRLLLRHLLLLLLIISLMNVGCGYTLPLARVRHTGSKGHSKELSFSQGRCSTLQAGGTAQEGEGGALIDKEWVNGKDPAASGVALFTALSSLSILVSYADRSNLATAIIPMAVEFHWDKSFQGVVLASFFLGYAVTQMIGGWLADRTNGRFVLMGGLAAWSFFTILTPLTANAGAAPLVATRVGLGLGEGLAFPSIHALISQRVPPAQQSTVVATITAASYAGAFVAFGLSPLIIARYNWEAVFYFFGGSSLFLLPLWWFLGGDSPTSSPPPPPSESSWSSTAVSSSLLDDSGSAVNSKAVRDVPRSTVRKQSFETSRDMDMSSLLDDLMRLGGKKEVWAIIVAQFCQSVGMYGLLSWLPTYMHDEYDVKVEDLAAYTTLPYALNAAVGVGAGVLADGLIRSGWRVKTVRQVLQVAGMVGPALLLTCLNLNLARSAEEGAALLAIGTALSALSLGGVSVNHLDIAPRSAGLVFGCGNTAATLAGFLVVPLSGWIFDTTSSWANVFTLFATSYLVGAVLYAAWVGDEDIDLDAAINGAEDISTTTGDGDDGG